MRIKCVLVFPGSKMVFTFPEEEQAERSKEMTAKLQASVNGFPEVVRFAEGLDGQMAFSTKELLGFYFVPVVDEREKE